MPIELPGLFVFGVDDQCADSKFGASGAIDCIPQQGGSEFAAMAVRRNCQSSQTRDRNRRIPRKTFCQGCRHLRKGDTGGGERVESRDVACGSLARYKTGGDAPANILANLLMKVSVQRFDPARKPRSIVT